MNIFTARIFWNCLHGYYWPCMCLKQLYNLKKQLYNLKTCLNWNPLKAHLCFSIFDFYNWCDCRRNSKNSQRESFFVRLHAVVDIAVTDSVTIKAGRHLRFMKKSTVQCDARHKAKLKSIFWHVQMYLNLSHWTENPSNFFIANITKALKLVKLRTIS